MKYEAKTPTEYVDAVQQDNDWRAGHLDKLRSLIKLKAPEVIEDIDSNVLRYSGDDRILCHINAQKNHIGPNVGDVTSIDNAEKFLAGVDLGKGCIRFKKELIWVAWVLLRLSKHWLPCGETVLISNAKRTILFANLFAWNNTFCLKNRKSVGCFG